MAWAYDAPSGTFKNHSLSSKIRTQAVADAKFMKYLTIEPGFGKHKGESVTITRILRLGNAHRVGETDRLPYGRPPIETKTVGISEWGFKVPVTQFERDLMHFDIMNPIQAALRSQIEMTMDVMAASALKLTPIKYVPTSAGFNLTTNGTPSGIADRNLTVQDLRELHDYMAGELKIPPYSNGKYVLIGTTRALRGLKDDPEYKAWLAPTTSDPMTSGMLKDIEGFHIVETNNYGAADADDDALDNLAGNSTVLGEAIAFGADAGGLLQVQAPELRMGVPEDLGRFRDVGWVAILEAFLVWEKASLARAVHITSA